MIRPRRSGGAAWLRLGEQEGGIIVKKDFEFADEFCEKMQNAVQVAVAAVKQNLLAGLRAAKSPQALYGALRELSARDGDVITWSMTIGKDQVYTMEAVAGYIFAEMLTNCDSAVASGMKKFNELPSAMRVLGRIDSYFIWTVNVAPGMQWDHKAWILAHYGRFSYDSATKRLYMYDIWSNVHYGFVGAAASFTAWELTAGAGAANLMSSLGASLITYGQADDPRDQAAIRLGIDLWLKYGRGLDFDSLVSEIRDFASSLTTFECNSIAKLAP